MEDLALSDVETPYTETKNLPWVLECSLQSASEPTLLSFPLFPTLYFSLPLGCPVSHRGAGGVAEEGENPSLCFPFHSQMLPGSPKKEDRGNR